MNYLIIVYLIIFYLIIDFIKKNRKLSKNDPPSPLALPIIGHLHKFGSIPHRSLTELSKRYGGVYSLYIGDCRTVVLSDPISIREVCVKQFENFVDRPHTKSTTVIKDHIGLAFADYEQWKKNRKLVSSAFTKTKIKTFTDLIEKQTKYLISSMNNYSNNNELFYPKKYLSKLAINVICSMIFSKEIEQNESLDKGTMQRLTIPFQEAFKKVGADNLDDYISILRPFFYFQYKQYSKYIYEIFNFVKEIYDQHLIELDSENPKDLMDQIIIETQGNEKETIILIAIDLLMAGSDTSASSIEWFCLYLINNPQIQMKAYSELIEILGNDCKFVTLDQKDKLPYFNSIIKEVLRIRPPGPLGIPRICRVDTEVNGYFIPKNTQILLNLYGLGNTYVSEAEQFKPERWIEYKIKQQIEKNKEIIKQQQQDESPLSNNNYFNDLDKVSIPFSIGQRSCIGSNLAESTIFSVCSNILLNFEMKSKNNNEIINDTELFGLSIHAKEFPIKLISRN